MNGEEEPIKRAADDETDFYDVASWEERTSLDGLAVAVYGLAVRGGRMVVILLALLILIAIGGLSALTEPAIGLLTVLSVIPALALTGYVWYSDVTTSEPLSLLVATFLLGVLTANFAAVLNSILQPFFAPLGVFGLLLFFYLVVGPTEEAVKLLAVRLYAYHQDRFEAVIDGAVYGAVAGLGFATIENALYITRALEDVGSLALGAGLIGAGGDIAAIRALAGPGHVIYSAFAGYYLGLAKFNPGQRGPIAVKGLIIASFIHATYNVTVGIGSGLIHLATGIPMLVAFLVYVVLYDGLFGYLLYRKIRRYRDAYRTAHRSGSEGETAEAARDVGSE